MSLRIAFSGPSGVGKGSVIPFLMKWDQRLQLSKSVTTRPRRPGDVKYTHVTHERFAELIECGHFIEYRKVHGNHLYGTPVQAVHPEHDLLLEIDCMGAFEVKEKHPETKMIFMLPSSREALEKQLRGRNTVETEEEIQRRLRYATEEIACTERFDCWVVNKMLESTAARILQIIMHLRAGHPIGSSFRNKIELEKVRGTFRNHLVSQ